MVRTKNKTDFRLLTKVSKLYYEDNLIQDDIVARLHISRSTISRLLAQARDEGVVKIVVTPPTGIYSELEGELEQKYAMKEVIIVDVPTPESPQMISRELGAAAANYLSRVITADEVIGVSWGYTIRGMVAALEPRAFPGVRIVQMTGGIGKPEYETYATELCQKMARTLSCKLALLPAPGVVHSKQTYEVYIMDEHVRTVMNLLPSITLAFVGVGSPNSYSISVRDENILTQSDLDQLVTNGVVGDIALRFIDHNGSPVRLELDDRIIGIDIEHLQKIPRVVGVAGGTDKVKPVHAALTGKLVNILITDFSTAHALVNL